LGYNIYYVTCEYAVKILPRLYKIPGFATGFSAPYAETTYHGVLI